MGDTLGLIPYILLEKYQASNLKSCFFLNEMIKIIKTLPLKAILVYFLRLEGTLNQF